MASVYMWRSDIFKEPKREIRHQYRNVFLVNVWLCLHPSGWLRVQLSVFEYASFGASLGLCCGLPIVSGSAVLTVVYSYSPCVVYCGLEPTLGLIPLQIRLPEKLLWWNVRQEKGRWGQTEKLFSLSFCFTLLTSVQNPHLAVIASMREEVKVNECGFMHVRAWFHVQLQVHACVHVGKCRMYACVHAYRGEVINLRLYLFKEIPHIAKN